MKGDNDDKLQAPNADASEVNLNVSQSFDGVVEDVNKKSKKDNRKKCYMLYKTIGLICALLALVFIILLHFAAAKHTMGKINSARNCRLFGNRSPRASKKRKGSPCLVLGYRKVGR